MTLQTQRLLGQQSLAEFTGLHVHLDQIFNDNLNRNVCSNTCIDYLGSGDHKEEQYHIQHGKQVD